MEAVITQGSSGLIEALEGIKGRISAAITHLTNAVVLSMLDDLTASIDAGANAEIHIYADTIPTDADTAIAAQVKLTDNLMAATSFPAAADTTGDGTLTASAIADDTSINATDTATWCRMLTAAAGTTIGDFDVGTGAEALVFNSVAFSSGATASITAWLFVMNETG